ncbi:MAG: FAD-dependent oxidoreductase, partial [Flavobacteriales bacterium]|nr:FAD-dependent oxidoreductase [Flavobacteriales bacterium]
SMRKTLEKFPSINDKNLKGSYQYFDAVTSDARLCNEIIHEAVNDYSSVALNYFELTAFETESGKVVAKCMDHLDGKEETITAKYMINASGPWMDELSEKMFQNSAAITAPSKGTHIVLSKKRFPIENAVIFSTVNNDGRLLYTVPWENDTVVVGATDTEYSGPIDTVEVDVSDDEYILKSLNLIVPSLGITKDDIISSFVGIRPLLKDENLSSKDRSREYKIWWVKDLVLNMFGGKLTGFQSMAQKAIRMVKEKGGGGTALVRKQEKEAALVNTDSLPADLVRHIKDRYNQESNKIFHICLENSSATKKLHDNFDIYKAEVIYFARHQSCCHIDDVLGRRLSLSYVLPKLKDKEEVVRRTADILRTECGWNDEEYLSEQKQYLNLLKQKNLYL